MNLDSVLRRAADFQKLTNPDDELSKLVQQVLEKTELSEEDLDYVAAAAAEPTENYGAERDKKEH